MITTKKSPLFRIALLIVAVFAFFVRIYRIEQFPPALNWDEVSLGYNAYSISETGMDEWGEKNPLIFRAYGDYKLPVYIYTLLPFIRIFGLNEVGVRLPSVLAGTGIVFLTYFFVLELLRKSKNNNIQLIALLSAFLVAVEPWCFFLSRAAFEANLSQFFIVLGVYLFLRSMGSAVFLLPLSVFFLGISVWTYNSARIFVPLLMFFLILVYKEKISSIFKNNKNIFSFTILALVILFLPMFYQLTQNIGQARYHKVSIVDQGAVGKIIGYRNKSQLPWIVTKLVYNRYTFFSISFARNWINHFLPNFLFFEGGDNYQFSIPSKGVLYLINLPLFYLGIFYLIKNYKQNKNLKILFYWMILAPIASSITRESPHVLRSITFLPIPMTLSAVGLSMVTNLYRSKILPIYISYVLIVLIFFFGYAKNYFIEYPLKYSSSWQYGYKKMTQFVNNNFNAFDRIIITKKYGEPHEFLLFYSKTNPSKFIGDSNLVRYEKSEWYWIDRYEKFLFVNDWEIPKEEWEPFAIESRLESLDCRDIKCLLITSPGNFPKTWTKISEINFLDATTAFQIYTNKK